MNHRAMTDEELVKEALNKEPMFSDTLTRVLAERLAWALDEIEHLEEQLENAS